MKEMWDSVAGNGDESGEDDDRFIDDEGVPEEDRVVYSDGEGSDRDQRHPEAEEAEEDEEEEGRLFGKGKKKKLERTPEEIAMFVEQFMAKVDVAAETDADLNRNSKPAIEKLKMLPELWTVLQKRQLQMEFLDRGVLSSLKDWLEPLPDGSLPNMNIRTTLLKLLTDLPIDVEQFERREQLKKSGLGKVVMFLSRLPEETPANKKLARDLVDKWSRPLFQKSTRYEDLRTYDEERPMPRRTPVKKAPLKRANIDRADDLDMLQGEVELKRGDPGYRQHASRPEALPLDFVRRPESKVDPQEFQNRARQQRQDEKRMKMNKKLQQLKTTKKSMQASKISVEGRGAVHYF
jgi:transcription factor SPN1